MQRRSLTDERQEFREVFQATMRVVAEMSQRQDAHTQVQAEILKTISEMQSEVRGLQVENRRILDRLSGDESWLSGSRVSVFAPKPPS